MALLHCLAHQPCSPWQAEHQLRVQVQHELAPGKDLPRHSDVLKVQHLQPEVDTEANPLEMAGLAGPDLTVPSPPAHHLTCYLCGYSQLKMKVGKGQPLLQEPTSKQDQVAQSCVLLSLSLSLQGWRFLHLLGCPLQYHIIPWRRLFPSLVGISPFAAPHMSCKPRTGGSCNREDLVPWSTPLGEPVLWTLFAYPAGSTTAVLLL